MANYFRAYRADQQPEGGPLRFIAATEAVARDGMIIDSTGWQLENYRANPVVLWAHDYTGHRPPIGRADITVDSETGNLMADITFDSADSFAADVERKYRDGFMNAVSVGWNTIEMSPSGDGRSLGRVTKAELLDISAVPVPGDPGALIEREKRGLLEDIGKQLSRIAEDHDSADDAMIPEDVDWAGTALLMARLYLEIGDDAEDQRRQTWVALARRYDRLGKQPPEFMSRAELAVLGTDEIRGLFLSDEMDIVGGVYVGQDARAGAVLSQRNKGDLEQAVVLIRSVLDRASIVGDNAADDETPKDKSSNNERMARYVAALETIKNQLGEN